jgi:hypothetical protein
LASPPLDDAQVIVSHKKGGVDSPSDVEPFHL